MSTTTTSLVRPVRTIGNDGAELAAAFLNARAAVREIILSVEAAWPNRRDYYVQPNGSFEIARVEFERIREGLAAVAQDLLALADPEERNVSEGVATAELPTVPSMMPSVHTNGTARGELRDQAVAVFRASQNAVAGLASAVPNMRDFADTEAWLAARTQHAARLEALQKVAGYFLALAAFVKKA